MKVDHVLLTEQKSCVTSSDDIGQLVEGQTTVIPASLFRNLKGSNFFPFRGS